MPHSWMLALKFAVKLGKWDLYTRNSFASTLITSQTDKCQGEHESYQMVNNDMSLDHTTSSTLPYVCTLKCINFLSFWTSSWWAQVDCAISCECRNLPCISNSSLGDFLDWNFLDWIPTAELYYHFHISFPHLAWKNCTLEEGSWGYFEVLLLHPMSTLWAATQNSKTH